MLQIKNTLGGGKPEGLYAWKKCENNTDHTFIDYVVSDKETAYPDGAVHTDGYYYEKVGSAKIATGSFTVSGVTELEIAHGLGTIPTQFIIYPAYAEGSSRYIASGLYINNSGHYWCNVAANTSGYGYANSNQPYKSYSSENVTCSLDDNKIVVPKAYGSQNTGYLYKWKGTFRWIAIAE